MAQSTRDPGNLGGPVPFGGSQGDVLTRIDDDRDFGQCDWLPPAGGGGDGDLDPLLPRDGSRPMTGDLRLEHSTEGADVGSVLEWWHERDGQSVGLDIHRRGDAYDLRFLLKSQTGEVIETGRLRGIDGMFMARRDGAGYETSRGGRFYERPGGGVALRQDMTHRQPQIEGNQGENPRDIIDTQNGDQRYVRRDQFEALESRLRQLEGR